MLKIQQLHLQLKRLPVHLGIAVLLVLNVCHHVHAFSHDYGRDDISSISINFTNRSYLIRYNSSNSLCRSYLRNEGRWSSEEIYTSTADECLMRIAESFSSETDVQNQQEIKKLLFGLIIRLFVFVSLSWVFRLVSSVFVNDL